ncbi:photosystem II biogenesis protein Psp29 [Oscillatoria sp. CS-180]|uniref:photosystem II biogenesis protein Psp29 n=1 Tax=Oscillatoria sp. CS-180 TaxID=3021720 RepID=UPI00232E358D|nr:photosystem II biogenesis protein Psp29 [Oscillatoria sp. CS-180]MDB9526179.1 photosystem II biogenesis protein Psp29 [Oscillatoria sp. CS-180]
MSNVRTVSDTKRAFYDNFDRPVTSVYRRVIEELMVEMHLLSVSGDFVYDPIYALGIVTTYDTFMEGYRPEGDIEPIFSALCRSIESSPEQYRGDAQQVLSMVEGMSMDTFKNMLTTLDSSSGEGLAGILKGISERDRFKYSRAFGIGLYTLTEKIDPELVKDKEKLMTFMKETAETLSISFDKLQKDIELYISNLDKMVQAKALMAEMLEAERKKREERAQAKAEKVSSAEAGSADDETPEKSDSAPVPTTTGEGSEE